MKLDKYKNNLSIVTKGNYDYIKSYDTLVARIEGDEIIQHKWYSVTTQKHINYAAKQLNKRLIKLL